MQQSLESWSPEIDEIQARRRREDEEELSKSLRGPPPKRHAGGDYMLHGLASHLRQGRELAVANENMVASFHAEVAKLISRVMKVVGGNLPETVGVNEIGSEITAVVNSAFGQFERLRVDQVVDFTMLPWSQIQHQVDKKVDFFTGMTNFCYGEYLTWTPGRPTDVVWLLKSLRSAVGNMLPASLVCSQLLDAGLAVGDVDILEQARADYKWQDVGVTTHSQFVLRHSKATNPEFDSTTSLNQLRPFPLRYLDSSVPLQHFRPWEAPKDYTRPVSHDPGLIHWGQRKLLMTEVDFLSLYSNPGDVVLYIGSAPGHHLDYLAGVLFQDLKFVLYDPAPFNPKLTKIQNVTIKNDFFTMDDAMAFRKNNTNLLFVSDIRRLQLVHEEALLEDMARQSSWHKTMVPKASLLKFRLPKSSGQSLYLEGELMLQPYAAPYSYEGRLLCARVESEYDDNVPTGDVIWDHDVYHKRLDHFNSIIRTDRSDHECREAGIDDNWDGHAEIDILGRFLRHAWLHQRYPFNVACDFNGVAVGDACPDPDASWRIVKLSREITYKVGWRTDWIKRVDANYAKTQASSGYGVPSKFGNLENEDQQVTERAGGEFQEDDFYDYDLEFLEFDPDTGLIPAEQPIVYFNSPIFLNSDSGGQEFEVHHAGQAVKCSVLGYRQLQGLLHPVLNIDARAKPAECERHLRESAHSYKRFVCALKFIVNAQDKRSMTAFKVFCQTMSEKSRIALCSMGSDLKVYIAPAEMLSTLTFLKDFIDTDELSDDSGPDPFLYGVAILKLYTDRPKKSKSAHGEISNGEAEDKATHVVLSDLLSEVGDTEDLAHDVGTVTEEISTHQIVK